ncbi:hypothetical protein WMF30_15605 [Sorangium sp. So ce134]
MKTAFISMACNLRCLAYAKSALLLGVLSLGCVAGSEGDFEEEPLGEAAGALTSYEFEVRETTTSMSGDDLGLKSQVTCFLSGVAGNLSEGYQWYHNDVKSAAWVTTGTTATGTQYMLVAHGGAFQNNVNAREWINNPVRAHATCFPTTTNVKEEWWEGRPADLGMAPPVKIAELDPNNRRQCFLSGIRGVDGAWDNIYNVARVVKQTTPDLQHPTTGWYVEGYLMASEFHEARPEVQGRCVDFPVGTVFNDGEVTAPSTGSKTETITSGTGTKACALTAIVGRLNQNVGTDGALIYEPTAPGEQWTMTVTNGKSATYVCAK